MNAPEIEGPGGARQRAGANEKDRRGHDARKAIAGQMYKWRERPAFQPRHEIVAGLLAPGELCLLTGAPGSGKSTVAVALACAVLTGSPFLGRACQRGAVAYLATERGRALPRRLEAAGAGDDVALAIRPRPFSLVARTELAAVVEEIRQCVGLPRLIVIDTLAKSIPGVEENSAKEMGVVADALAKLSEEFPSAAIVIVHHTSKNGETVRGSSALLGAVDLELRIEQKRASRLIRVAKANEVTEDQIMPFALETVTLPDSSTTTRAVAVATGAGIATVNEKRAADAKTKALGALAHLPQGRDFAAADVAQALVAAGIINATSPKSATEQARRLLRAIAQQGVITEQDGRFRLVDGGTQ